MAIKTKPDNSAVTLDSVVATMNKSYGPGTMILGSSLKKDPPRIPSGIFAVDFTTGGGIPLYATTCLWGAEQSGKTTIALKIAASASKLCWTCFKTRSKCECDGGPKLMRVVWEDVEGTLDAEWAERLGADPDSYHFVLAESGEQFIDVADYVLRADDCGLVIVDSLAHLVPSAELEASAEDQFMGKQATMIGRFVRKIKQRLITERKRGHPCAVVFINQMRMRVGVSFGDPEIQPGGYQMKHEFSLLFRTSKKALQKKSGDPDAKYFDAARSKDMASRHSFSIRKEKILTLSGIGEFVVLKESIPELGLEKGMIDEATTVISYAKDYGLIRNDGSKWWIWDGKDGKKANKIEEIKAFWNKYPEEYLSLKMEIIREAKNRIGHKSCQS